MVSKEVGVLRPVNQGGYIGAIIVMENEVAG